jgi:hypothetical protein
VLSGKLDVIFNTEGYEAKGQNLSAIRHFFLAGRGTAAKMEGNHPELLPAPG